MQKQLRSRAKLHSAAHLKSVSKREEFTDDRDGTGTGLRFVMVFSAATPNAELITDRKCDVGSWDSSPLRTQPIEITATRLTQHARCSIDRKRSSCKSDELSEEWTGAFTRVVRFATVLQ